MITPNLFSIFYFTQVKRNIWWCPNSDIYCFNRSFIKIKSHQATNMHCLPHLQMKTLYKIRTASPFLNIYTKYIISYMNITFPSRVIYQTLAQEKLKSTSAKNQEKTFIPYLKYFNYLCFDIIRNVSEVHVQPFLHLRYKHKRHRAFFFQIFFFKAWMHGYSQIGNSWQQSHWLKGKHSNLRCISRWHNSLLSSVSFYCSTKKYIIPVHSSIWDRIRAYVISGIENCNPDQLKK